METKTVTRSNTTSIEIQKPCLNLRIFIACYCSTKSTKSNYRVNPAKICSRQAVKWAFYIKIMPKRLFIIVSKCPYVASQRQSVSFVLYADISQKGSASLNEEAVEWTRFKKIRQPP
ncbi:MAG: hypothetical protein LBE15_05495 [Burkholderiales bacterium]|jgi:hypothetical protein|nr:hypothetical protein [Burkholderiales bacterium]